MSAASKLYRPQLCWLWREKSWQHKQIGGENLKKKMIKSDHQKDVQSLLPITNFGLIDHWSELHKYRYHLPLKVVLNLTGTSVGNERLMNHPRVPRFPRLPMILNQLNAIATHSATPTTAAVLLPVSYFSFDRKMNLK